MIEKKGLSPEHHGELNIPSQVYPGGEEAKKILIKELRLQYAANSVALQQIDVYDGDTEYHSKFSQYVDAFKKNDTEMIATLEAWFAENYPDIRYPNF